MTRLPSFAVLYFREPICDNDVMMPTVVRRFATYEAAEAFRAHRFGADNEAAAVVED
ncbi:MAG TPA: hypothetical protein VFR76_02010 [Verrucomicrobiae bacterium]|nr:hypothetical protein [Verrucomicrobiae bacterium]